MIRVFVYGTLKPGEANYQEYCVGKVAFHSKAYTYGYLYHLPVGYPGMTEGRNKVRGVLLTFKNPNILNSLDDLEGYQENRAFHLNEYYRQLVPIFSLNDRPLGKAWTYLMSLEKVIKFKGVSIDSGCWFSQ
jgi:gamma-glutamylcyclotransferase (GGCT)/AIG2-like uncharacterized protein YtfP